MDKLSVELSKWRADRPDEWIMDTFIREAKKLESTSTCTANERKFLDEIKRMSEYIPPRKTYDRMEVSASIIGSHDKDPYCYELWQCDFTADLSKVIKGE